MPMLQCLKNTIKSSSNEYPVYIGFLPAKEILQIAEAPSFSGDTTHQDIAVNIMTPPIKDWQRPLDEDRVTNISLLFNNIGEFMPNPVLLCENVNLNHQYITINQQQTREGGVPTNIWEVNVSSPSENAEKPLWILDGQHRINGLAKSLQANNPIPVVLLLNVGSNSYSGPLLAKIFAQVTTSATQLDDLHNEWLTFAFNLSDYSDSDTKNTEHRQAMIATAELCRQPSLSSSPILPNPFFNEIRFNTHRPAGPKSGGFAYTCIEIKELFRKYYYSCSSEIGNHLSPEKLAIQVGLAYQALTQVVMAPQDETVFFGKEEYSQRIMQDAFIIGVLSYLLKHSAPGSWEQILDNLSFRTTSWNFKSWVRTLSGSAQSTSRKLAISVFKRVFQDQSLPAGAGNLGDFLRGNNAKITFKFSVLDSNNRQSTKNVTTLSVSRGAVLTEQISPRRHIKISSISENIGRLTITDKNSPPGRVVPYDEISRRGMTLDESKHNKPLSLLIRMEHYGGNESSADVDISW